MEYFLLYCLFAVTTGLCSIYELIAPVMQRRIAETGFVENKKLWYVTFFLVFTFFAPVVFLSCIVPEWGITFREATYEAMFSDRRHHE